MKEEIEREIERVTKEEEEKQAKEFKEILEKELVKNKLDENSTWKAIKK